MDDYEQKNILRDTEANKILDSVKNDVLFVASILKKYNISNETYSSNKSLKEMTCRHSPLESEIEKFEMSIKNIVSAMTQEGITIGVQINISEKLSQIYFDKKFELN